MGGGGRCKGLCQICKLHNNISMYDWEKPLNVLMKKVYNYASLHSNVDDICTATAIVDLCRDRDNHRYDVFTHSDIIDIIQMLCTC